MPESASPEQTQSFLQMKRPLLDDLKTQRMMIGNTEGTLVWKTSQGGEGMTTSDDERDDSSFLRNANTGVTQDEKGGILINRRRQGATRIYSLSQRHHEWLLSEGLRWIQGLNMLDDVLSLHVTYEQQKKVNYRHRGSTHHTLNTEHTSETTILNQERHTNTTVVFAMPLTVLER